VSIELGIVASTQDEARRRFRDAPLLATADRQTRGRGRLGRGWENAARAVAASLAFVPSWPQAAWPALPLVAGLAAREAAGDDVRLKWPNDLVVGDRKVGGILSEAGDGLVVIGLGINLWWPDPVSGAAALLPVDPGPEAPQWIAEQWAEGLLVRVGSPAGSWGREDYQAVCDTIGRDLAWEPAGRGRAVGIDAEGGLIVETAEGTETLRAGEVREVRG
jgi:BirA family biotin operon repressor/biotin-[acetyl-CoA-carboxylase] ligase